jgi:hypothetical protein
MTFGYRERGARFAKFLATYGPAFLILLLPALFNGFPLVFSDTGTYLASAIERALPADRPIHYSLFLYALHLGRTLWPVVAAQAALTVAVLAIFFDVALGGRLRAPRKAALLAIVPAVSALPVLASELTPDLFTALLIGGLALLALRPAALTNIRKAFLYAVVVLAVCVHQANFLVAAVLLSTLAIARSRLKPSLAGPALAVCAGFGLLVAPNVLYHRSVSATRGSGVFLLAKLLDDGIGLDYLDEACKKSSYSICAELPALRAWRRNSPDSTCSDFFLWGGPLQAAGGWEEVRKYSGSVAAHCVLRYPGRFILASARDVGRQAVRLSTGEDIVPYGDESLVSIALKRHFPPAVYDEFRRSRQQSGRLDFARVSGLHICVVVLSVVLLGAFAKRLYAADTKLAAIVFALLAGYLANALVMGTLGRPVNRYQNRVSWLIPLAAIAAIYRLKTEKATPAA